MYRPSNKDGVSDKFQKTKLKFEFTDRTITKVFFLRETQLCKADPENIRKLLYADIKLIDFEECKVAENEEAATPVEQMKIFGKIVLNNGLHLSFEFIASTLPYHNAVAFFELLICNSMNLKQKGSSKAINDAPIGSQT